MANLASLASGAAHLVRVSSFTMARWRRQPGLRVLSNKPDHFSTAAAESVSASAKHLASGSSLNGREALRVARHLWHEAIE